MGIISTLLVASGVVFFVASRVATPEHDFRRSEGGAGQGRDGGESGQEIREDARAEAIETPFLDGMQSRSSSTDDVGGGPVGV